MKKLLVILTAISLCFIVWGIPVYGDPGDETDPEQDSTAVYWDNPDYPPPPPGWEGPWPPPDWQSSGYGADGGDEPGWEDPHE
jgi:hypothetical protein